MLVGAATVATIFLAGGLSTFGIDNEPSARQEFVGHLDGRHQVAAGVAAKVDGQILKTFLRQTGQGDEQFGIGFLPEILNPDVTSVVVEHVGGSNTLHGYLAAGDGDTVQLLFLIAQNAHLDLGILLAFQLAHSGLVGNLFTDEGLAVDLDNLVTCQHTGTLGRAVTNYVLNVDSILTNGELDAYAKERAF